MATAKRPLVVLFDGVNQLSFEHRADRLNWLPRMIPANVHLILSTTTGHPTFHALEALTSWLPPQSVVGERDVGCFVEVPPLSREVSVDLMMKWLHQAGRDLTQRQLQVVNNALRHCSLPLYTSLVFEEVSAGIKTVLCKTYCLCMLPYGKPIIWAHWASFALVVIDVLKYSLDLEDATV